MGHLFNLKRSLLGISLSRWLILAGVAVALVVLSLIIRGQLNIEWSIASLRAFVDGLGVWGPLAYIGILTFRFLFLIPSGLLLLVAGIIFGPVYGTLYAGLGLTGSALTKYCFSAIVGRDALLKQLPPKVRNWITMIATKKMSVWALAGVCAYPFFPKHVFQFAAILSGMRLVAYIPAVVAGGFIQGAIFANMGAAIYSGAGLMLASGIFLAGLILPMCVPNWRRWMLAPLTTKQETLS